MGKRRTLKRPTARRVALFESHLHIVEGYVARFGPWKAKRAGLEVDDLRQAARLGLWKAALRFDFRRGTVFVTLAQYAIAWAMHDACELARYGRQLRRRPLIDQSAFVRLLDDDQQP